MSNLPPFTAAENERNTLERALSVAERKSNGFPTQAVAAARAAIRAWHVKWPAESAAEVSALKAAQDKHSAEMAKRYQD